MQQFSPSDAALEGFRLTREHPFAILAWSGVYFAGIILMALVMMVGIGPEFVAILRSSGDNGVQEEQLAALLLQSCRWTAARMRQLCMTGWRQPILYPLICLPKLNRTT